MKKSARPLFLLGFILAGGTFASSFGWSQGEGAKPLLIEEKIVAITLKPEYRDGIQWNLVELRPKDRKSTTGAFPLSERARYRLDYNPMKKNVTPGQEENVDFEYVEQTRMNEFNFGDIWEDTRDPGKVNEDTHFGSLRIYQFKPIMDALRQQGECKVLFSRKWISESGEQSMISSQPELTAVVRGKPGVAGETEFWEGARSTIRPEIIKNNQIAFHLDSEIATFFYGDPLFHPGSPLVDRGGKQEARIWRLFRLNTKGIVESGQTAIFEDLRDGHGVIIFLTPYILEEHRKIFRD